MNGSGAIAPTIAVGINCNNRLPTQHLLVRGLSDHEPSAGIVTGQARVNLEVLAMVREAYQQCLTIRVPQAHGRESTAIRPPTLYVHVKTPRPILSP